MKYIYVVMNSDGECDWPIVGFPTMLLAEQYIKQKQSFPNKAAEGIQKIFNETHLIDLKCTEDNIDFYLNLFNKEYSKEEIKEALNWISTDYNNLYIEEIYYHEDVY